MRRVEEKTAGGIILTEQFRADHDHGAVIGKVLAMGEDVFGDKAKFPHGPLCKVGDNVMISRYEGLWFKHGDNHWKIIPDTALTCFVEDLDALDALKFRTKN